MRISYNSSLYKYYMHTIIHIAVRGPSYIAKGRYIYVYDIYVHIYESRAYYYNL